MNWKKIWHFIWEEDSIASWLVNIVLAFLIIKFIFYPILALVLGTSFPIVAVVSGSMEHDITKEYGLTPNGVEWTGTYSMCGNQYEEDRRVNFDVFWEECGSWYETRNITKEEFKKFKLKNGFNKGDIIILHSKKNIEQGDVIVYWSNKEYPIIHRVVEVEDGYRTKGDHNSRDDGVISDEAVLGKALFRVPYLGWLKIWFVDLIGLFRG